MRAHRSPGSPLRRATPGHRAQRRAWRLTGAQLRAILAGALVLGFGASATLASWTDDELATAAVKAGTFAVETSSTSATSGFAEHASEATELTFGSSLAVLAPGRTVYAPVWVRSVAGSVSGTVSVAAAAVTATAGANLVSYSVFGLAPTAACDVTASQASVTSQSVTKVLPATPVKVAGDTATLPAGGTGARSAADAIQLCFAFTLGATADNSLQGTTLASPVWTLTGQ